MNRTTGFSAIGIRVSRGALVFAGATMLAAGGFGLNAGHWLGAVFLVAGGASLLLGWRGRDRQVAAAAQFLLGEQTVGEFPEEPDRPKRAPPAAKKLPDHPGTAGALPPQLRSKP